MLLSILAESELGVRPSITVLRREQMGPKGNLSTKLDAPHIRVISSASTEIQKVTMELPTCTTQRFQLMG